MVLACNTRVACVSLRCSTHIARVFHASTYYLVAGLYSSWQVYHFHTFNPIDITNVGKRNYALNYDSIKHAWLRLTVVA